MEKLQSLICSLCYSGFPGTLSKGHSGVEKIQHELMHPKAAFLCTAFSWGFERGENLEKVSQFPRGLTSNSVE